MKTSRYNLQTSFIEQSICFRGNRNLKVLIPTIEFEFNQSVISLNLFHSESETKFKEITDWLNSKFFEGFKTLRFYHFSFYNGYRMQKFVKKKFLFSTVLTIFGSFPFAPPQLSGCILFATPRCTCNIFTQ